MPRQPFLSVIVPAYNEAKSITTTLHALRAFLDAQAYDYEVILAADGNDETPVIAAEIARAWPNLSITAEAGRHGKGHGIRRGVALANGDVIGFLDADYKTPIDEITKMLPWLEQGYDVVLGSRGLASSRITQAQPWYRRVGSRAFGMVMHLIIGLHHIRDTQCGFKFFTRRAAAEIFPLTRVDGYMCDVEYLWLASQLGYRMKEVGITWRDDGDSRLQLISGNVRNCRELLKIRFTRYGVARSHIADAIRVSQAER